jgi:hypothetical protein
MFVLTVLSVYVKYSNKINVGYVLILDSCKATNK